MTSAAGELAPEAPDRAAGPPPAGGARAARGERLAGLGDRLNPILVKELRQSLQGKFFRWVFLVTLVTATVIGCANILLADEVADLSGAQFFVAMYGCLSAAVHVFVPFSVFTSLGSEWEENTFDLLVISDLRPRQIALGKLLSAGTQVVLYYSAFGPFLIFAFLLKGLDLTAVAVILGGTLLTSALLSCVALALSSLSRQRVLRVLLLALLAGALVQSTAGSVVGALGIIGTANQLHHPDVRLALLGFAMAAVLLSAFFFAVTCSRLAHPEENGSSALRALALALVGAAVGWMLHLTLAVLPVPASDLQDIFPAALLLPLFALLVPSAFFLTEPERLGRRVRQTVPRNPLAALAAAPFLPGGGRALVLLLAQVAALAATGAWIRLRLPGGDGFPNDSDRAFLFGAGYALVYLGLPSALLARRTRSLGRLVAARLAIPGLLFLGLFVPSLIGFFLDIDGLDEFEHPGNPFWVVVQTLDGDIVPGAAPLVAALAAATLLVNLPRAVRGLREVLAASAARRRAARPDAASAP